MAVFGLLERGGEVGCGLTTHRGGEQTGWQAGFWVSQAPWAQACRPSLCLLLLASAPSSRSEVFHFPLSSIRTLALGAQREPRCFPCCPNSLLIWGMARRPGSASWKGGGDSGLRPALAVQAPLGLYRAQEARGSAASPGQAHSQCLTLLHGSRGSRPLQPVHTSCPELSAAWGPTGSAPCLSP